MNKHQIVECHWRDDETGEVLYVYAKSEARGWFNYYVAVGPYGSPADVRPGMIHRDGLKRFYTRVE